jgi:putative YpdA family bacillithiol system oxidoreductase
MQQLLIWLGVGVLVLAIFIPYFLQFRKGQKVVMERKKEAQAMGIDRPRAQYPMINRSLCIGCGSCVEACPEGDVIGVVWGVAEVINGERCVGHGYCETACPVGALKVGLGDVTNRPDIPILTPYHETTVAGLFIAGELGGLSLIRNAISQGSLVVEEIARRNVRGTDNALDLIIVGAGPAGLSAALAAVQHNLTYLVLDEKAVGGTILHYPRQKLVMTQPVEIPLYGRLKAEEYSKEALMEMWHSIIAEFKINIRTGERVETVRKRDSLFEIAVGDRTYYARQVVLAMGRRGSPRRMEVPGEELPKVLYQLIDAQSFRGKKMLVVGGGDSAVEAAVGLARQQGNVVTISYRKGSFFRVKKKNEDAITNLIADKKILPLFDSQILEVRPQSVVLSTKQGEREIPNDFVIVQIGGIPPFEMLKSMGIAFGGEQRPMKEIAAGTPLPVHT